MSKKILRVGFAMGGGVSLGTFCGTGLSQALKLLIVHGGYKVGNSFKRFDRVEVDVFSGASAGALSLAAMLRCLASPDPKKLEAAKAAVRAEFATEWPGLDDDQRADLVAAEIMQCFQRQLWTDEIKIGKLLGEGGDGELPFKASLLDRGAVDDIARRFIVDTTGLDFTRRRVLAERVLFAATLTNLTPVIWDAAASFPGKDVGFIGLNDGLRSSTHRDLRVFDLNFKSVPSDEAAGSLYADRWCLYHLDEAIDSLIGDLRKREGWAQIAATAIASGAFPVAFEPVVLPRKAFEYGPARWNRIMGRPKDTPLDGKESLPFSYVDGGTLNNEPIREAFRLASFIDGHTRASDKNVDFHRLIVFVDPNVAATRPSFRVPGHGEWLPVEPGRFAISDAPAVRRSPSLRRLLSHVGSVVGAVSDESRAIEADKVNEVRTQFALRDGVRQTLFNTLTRTPQTPELIDLMAFIDTRLAEAEKDETIPAGPMTLPGELERVCQEEIENDAQTPFRPLRGKAANFAADMVANPDAVADKDLWLRLLSFAAVDIILRLEGKLLNASLVAIAPFRNLGNIAAGGAPDEIWLPGGALSAFAGFMSDVPDEIEHAAAKYCAAEFLRACELVDPATPLPPTKEFVFTPAQRAVIEKKLKDDIDRELRRLANRVAAMVRDADFINIFPGIDGIVTGLINAFLKSKIKGIDWRSRQEQPCTFRVEVPNQNFEFAGDQRDIDARPVKNPATGKWELITIAAWDGVAKAWSGDYVKHNALEVYVDGTAFLKDRPYCKLPLPDAVTMDAQEFLPNPTFYVDATPKNEPPQPPADLRWKPLTGVTSLEARLLGRTAISDTEMAEIGAALVATVGRYIPARVGP